MEFNILGLIKALHKGVSAPSNTEMLWYDTNINAMKYYDNGTTSWIPIAPVVGLPNPTTIGDILISTDGANWIRSQSLVDGSAVVALSAINRTLLDSAAVSSIDWENKLMKTAAGTIVDWIQQLLNDSSANLSIDWDDRVAVESGGGTTIDWEGGYLRDASGNISLWWFGRALYDSSGALSVQYDTRILADSSADELVHFDTEFDIRHIAGNPVSYVTNKNSRQLHLTARVWNGAASEYKKYKIFHQTDTLTSKSWLVIYDTTDTEVVRVEDGGYLKIGDRIGMNPSSGSASTNGDVKIDSDMNAPSVRVGGLSNYLSGMMFNQTADVTVANSVVETTLLGAGSGTKTFPASYLTVGRSVKFRVNGYFSCTGSPTLTLRVKIGGTEVASGILQMGTWTNDGFLIEGSVVVRTIGATGTVVCSAVVNGEDVDTKTFIKKTSATTINTTVGNDIDITAEWSTADPSNTVTAQIATIEV